MNNIPVVKLGLIAVSRDCFPIQLSEKRDVYKRQVVDAAKKRKLDHEEMHSKVEYIVAHGISTTIEGKKAIIGSSHFVFEDEKCTIPEGMEERFKNLPNEYSHLYLAIEGSLAAVICIEDPLREEAPAVRCV